MSVAVFLIVLGAILYFAVSATVAGVELATIGLILMIIGAVYALYAIIVGGRRW